MAVTYLKSLQALEMAIRTGSLKSAADALGITPAALGQRVRSIENYLGVDLLVRGRSGLQPTPVLSAALGDLAAAFQSLEKASEKLDFQRVSEIHIVADPDWAELWLSPRLPGFRDAYPNILFCINGAGDIPVRLGAPDLRITNGPGPGEAMYHDIFLPVTGPDNPRRIAGNDPVLQMEGMSLLHTKTTPNAPHSPGWVDWFKKFGQRQEGQDRGVHYQNARLALQAARQDVGFMLCGLSLAWRDIAAGTIVLPFPAGQHLVAPNPYRLALRQGVQNRPQTQSFINWLHQQAGDTRDQIQQTIAVPR